ncbi:uncharacterized protein LOC124944706 [Impatiens glandulifera]|uniref:uncharacterized protein LOC124944706 n=1 Tax=Impatiens glandulifera TaxID=253017 RepID=UPI001FB1920C|nr:uncharacterized protein LOC124944706 [Impatiens glandulifera]
MSIMADSRTTREVEKAMKKKKRKMSSSREEVEQQRPAKTVRSDYCEEEKSEQHIEAAEKLEDCPPWRNLSLILVLQNKTTNVHKKVELAFNYVKLGVTERDNDREDLETVSISRVVTFLNDWVQSLLISSEKRIRTEQCKPHSETMGSCLDNRCWEILKFCLEKSLVLHLSLNISRDILRVVHCIVKHVTSTLFVEPDMETTLFGLYGTVLDCLQLVFSSHGGVSNESLDLWILVTGAVLELVQKTLDHNKDGNKVALFSLQLSLSVLEPFGKFLKIHPIRKNVYHEFLDKLLDPLLHLLNVLSCYVHGRDSVLLDNILQVIKDILSHGLFHSVHIDGFMNLQVGKHAISGDELVKDAKVIIKSYHRHLFDKLEMFLLQKRYLTLGGVGELFHLFINCVKNLESTSASGGFLQLKEDSPSDVSKLHSNNKGYSLIAETRKSVFNFFAQILEPYLLEFNSYLKDEVEAGYNLPEIQATLRTTSNVLHTFVQENVYIRVEEDSDGASLNFLKVIYDIVLSLSGRVNNISPLALCSSRTREVEMLLLIAKELIIILQYLVKIDYEVIRNDLENLWMIIFSFAALALSSSQTPEEHTLTTHIIHLGCQLVNLYSDLRQVNNAILAMCKAARTLILPNNFGERTDSNEYVIKSPALGCDVYGKSIRILLTSSEFRLAIHKAIVSTPEGQASSCIRILETDIFESLQWLKLGVAKLDAQAELLGTAICDLYVLVFDSLTVTSGNSKMIGLSVNNLIKLLCPFITGLVQVNPGSCKELLRLVVGEDWGNTDNQSNLSSCYWLVLLFFRLYMSCRYIYRQVISFAPPKTSIKMSEEMGDLVTAYSGKDLLERTDWTCGGYFSWAGLPSASLLRIMQSLSSTYISNKANEEAPLIYVMNMAAIQRLVELNRLMKSSEYVSQWIKSSRRNKVKDESTCPVKSKGSKKLKKHALGFKQEAEDLTNFIMGHLSLLVKDQDSISSYIAATSNTSNAQSLHQYDERNSGIGVLGKRSLPYALWKLFSQSLDIWCGHASKKHLKKFLSLLIDHSVSSLRSEPDDFGRKCSDEPGHHRRILGYLDSLGFLNDTIFYEQRFVCRHMASRFSSLLENSARAIFSSSVDVDLMLPLDCSAFMSIVGEPLSVCVVECSKSLKNTGESEESTSSLKMEFTVCEGLLNFLYWKPKDYMDSKSLSLYTTCIFNLERIIVQNLLRRGGVLCLQNQYKLLRLLLSCRRANKSFLESGSSIITTIFYQSSFPALWLSKSLSTLIKSLHSLSDNGPSQMKEVIFSLMDHTSYTFLALSKYHILSANKHMNEESSEGQDIPGCSDDDGNMDDSDAWKIIGQVAETLTEQLKNSLLCLSSSLQNENLGSSASTREFNNLSSTISCCYGFLWGFSSSLDNVDFSRSKSEVIGKIKYCINVLSGGLDYVLRVLFVEDSQMPSGADGDLTLPVFHDIDGCLKIQGPLCKDNEIGDCSDKSIGKKKSSIDIPDSMNTILTKYYPFKLCSLKNTFLKVFLKGKNLEVAFFLRQIFIVSAALLRLNLNIKTDLPSSSVSILIDFSLVLFQEFVNEVEVPHPLSFVWLDGVVMFLEELGNHFPRTDSIMSRDLYAKLIDLHLQGIGRCIALQGKRATLAVHEMESSTKTISGHSRLGEPYLSYGSCYLDEFKCRLRMSFKAFMKKSPELHTLSAIQALERALVGAHQSTISYEVCTGCTNGGTVSPIVAAAIECLDLVLEFVTGRKRLSIIKRHIQKFVSCLSNIILHLQCPQIFYGKVIISQGPVHPDSGAAILMCIEVMTRVLGRHSLYQLDPYHVVLSLRIPGSVFKHFLQTKDEMHAVDRRLSIDLFAACCRLLCTVVKHRTSDIVHNVALVGDSVSILLHCLEIPDGKGCFAWELQEGVKCAYFLRRIYEEIRQQKDAFGGQCSLFLSIYIRTYSGYGPLKMGIKREIDEAMRPGIYALIDACSEDDLQYLHTIFGEGPCRNTLAALQHDYKTNFQYEGKV